MGIARHMGASYGCLSQGQPTIIGRYLGVGVQFEMGSGKEVNKTFSENSVLGTAATEDNGVNTGLPAQVAYHIGEARYKTYMKKEGELSDGPGAGHHFCGYHPDNLRGGNFQQSVNLAKQSSSPDICMVIGVEQ
jgi:hypothetical protein